METCPTVPLRNISLSENVNLQNNEPQNESKMEINTNKLDIEIVGENLNGTKERKKITPILISKNIEKKKIKPIEISCEKRKFSEKEKPDICKKVKKRKKEEKLFASECILKIQSNTVESKTDLLDDEKEIVVLEVFKKESEEKMSPNSKELLENNLVLENKEKTGEKFKSKRSSRKSKILASACKNTLDILMKLEMESLFSINKSLKTLKELHLLNNKHVPINTLMDLISLAMETNQATNTVDAEKETTLFKIINKLTVEMSSSPKSLKARKSLLSESNSPKDKNIEFSECLTAGKVELPNEISKYQFEEKMEGIETTSELTEKNLEQTVEKSGKNFCITNYFKKLKKTSEERNKNERFSSFMMRVDMSIAPKRGGELIGDRREKFEQELNNQTCEVKNVFKENPKYSASDKRKSNNKCQSFEVSDNPPDQLHDDVEGVILREHASVEIISIDETPNASNVQKRKKVASPSIDQPKIMPVVAVPRTKAKLLQFHENRRPPYWGTWRRKSGTVGPRKPFQLDKFLNYEVDSDDEWEEEEEPGESLHGSEDEKEPEEDYEVDNDFFVPHGYLSDDENPEKENISPKTKLDLLEKQFTFEQKQKTSKMTPFVFGIFWIGTSGISEESQYQDMQIQNLEIVPWVPTPIEIAEEDDKKIEALNEPGESTTKKRCRIQFPEEEIPNLIKMIHGSTQTIEFLAKKFLLYWDEEKVHEGPRYGLTKICVLKKIKELASYQTKTWLVPKEIRKEFGADSETESPPKKPQKCFIWKFVKRTEKSSEGASSPSGNPEPEIVAL